MVLYPLFILDNYISNNMKQIWIECDLLLYKLIFKSTMDPALDLYVDIRIYQVELISTEIIQCDIKAKTEWI